MQLGLSQDFYLNIKNLIESINKLDDKKLLISYFLSSSVNLSLPMSSNYNLH